MRTITMVWSGLVLALFLVVGCAPSQINGPWGGESIDLMADDAEVTVTPAGNDAIKVSIKVEGSSETCNGSFEMTNSRSGIPLFSGPLKSYKGSWDKITTKACEDAIGGKGGIVQYIDIRDPSLFGSSMMQVCNPESNETICLAANTFKIEEKGM